MTSLTYSGAKAGIRSQNGFETDSYEHPSLALKNFRANMYDLLLLDIKMPDINGMDLYQEMRKIDDKVKVCFLTAGEMPYGIYQDIFDKNEFIRKPIENQELLSRLDRILNS